MILMEVLSRSLIDNNNIVTFDRQKFDYQGDIDECAMILYKYVDSVKKESGDYVELLFANFVVNNQDNKYFLSHAEDRYQDFVDAFNKINDLRIFI